MQKNIKNNSIIVAIFNPADPLRKILRDYASCKDCDLSFYNHQLDAISCIPLTNKDRATLILARPENLSVEGLSAFEMLMNKETTRYALWLEKGDFRCSSERYLQTASLHAIENLQQLHTMLATIQIPFNKIPPRRSLNIPKQPLSSQELDALLEIGL